MFIKLCILLLSCLIILINLPHLVRSIIIEAQVERHIQEGTVVGLDEQGKSENFLLASVPTLL